MEEDLLFISTHDYGSFVIEQFLTSETVKKTYKKRFLQKVKVSVDMCEFNFVI